MADPETCTREVQEKRAGPQTGSSGG